MRPRFALGLFATHLYLTHSASAIPIFDAIPGLSLPLSFLGESVGRGHYGSAAGGVTDEGEGGAGVMGEPKSEGEGWLARWLAFGGEGEVMVKLPNTTLLLPHRPASFPSYLPHYLTLPISGHLVSIETLSNSSSSSSHYISHHSSIDNPAIGSPTQACSPVPFSRYYPPKRPYTIALIERGACDFASKVLFAQSLGAAGVIVGDTKAYPGETDEEGRERRGLLTMFSPSGEVEDVRIPSVFVSRAGYLLLRDLLVDGVVSEPGEGGEKEGGDDGELGDGAEGGMESGQHGDTDRAIRQKRIPPEGTRSNATALWIELGEARNEGGTIGNLLSFSLLMPSCFLIITIVGNRARVARQRRLDRAPPEVVLALPERVWQPDIAWEKSSSSSASVSPSGRVNGSGSGSATSRSGRGEPSRHSGLSSTGTSPSPFSRQSGVGGERGAKGAVVNTEDAALAATLPNLVPLQTQPTSSATSNQNAGADSSAGGSGATGRSRSSTAMSSASAQTMHTARTSHSRSSDLGTGLASGGRHGAGSGSGSGSAAALGHGRYGTASAPISPVDASAHSSSSGGSWRSGVGSDDSNTPTPTASTFRSSPIHAEATRGPGRVMTRTGRTREHSAPLPSRSERDRETLHSHSRSRDRASHVGLPDPLSQPAPAASMADISHKTQHAHARVQKRYYAQDECAICMDDFQPGQIVRILPCGHVFHKDECDEWLMKWRKLCPTCRADVTIPARAMAGSTITPVLFRDPSGAEVLTAEPGVIGPNGDNVRMRGFGLNRRLGAAGRVIGRAGEGAGQMLSWVGRSMRGIIGRQRGEGGEWERLVPRPNEDEV